MFKKKYFLITIIAFLLVTIPSTTHFLLQARAHTIVVQEVEHKINSAGNYQSNTIRVEFEDNIPLKEIQKLVEDRNIPPIFEGTYYERVRYIEVEEDEIFEKMVEYSKKDVVKSVDLNHIFTIESWSPDGESRALPIDWDTSKHWYYDKIKLPEAWKEQGCLDSLENCGGSSDVVVAVFDTGLALDNYTAYFEYNSTAYGPISFEVASEIVGINLWENPTGKNANNGFCNDFHGVDIAIAIENGNSYGGANPCNSEQLYKEGQPNDDHGHGTFVSGIISSATNNSINTSVGVAHNVSILTIKGNIPFTQDFTFQALEEGILYAAEYADILNMSVGGGSFSSALNSAINHAVSQGVVVVAASGNDPNRNGLPVSYPAAYENAIAVGAVNADNSRSDYSNYGPELDFVAPVGQGGSAGNATWQETLSCIPNCDPENATHFTEYGHRYSIGTSYASPQVAAAAALIKSFNPTLSHHEVKEILITTVDDIGIAGKDDETGYGLLNLQNIYNSFYTLEYTAGEGGTIGGETNQNVFHGGSGTEVTAVANTGYEFQAWSDGITTASRTDTNVTADITVTANFEPNQYTLTYTAGAGGTIDGEATQTVAHGQDGATVTATPNEGYHFTNWNDGVTTASRTDTNVTTDITVTANFEINQYTLTYTAGEGGTITGDTNQTVVHGENGTEVTAAPNSGYEFQAWSDGITTASRTDTNVTADIIVTANFEPDQYTLTYTAGAGGTIDGEATQTVAHGQDGATVTAIANEGYTFTNWSDGITTASRTDTNITGDINVTASFNQTEYTLTYTAGTGGTITGNTNQTVVHGGNGTEVTAVPNSGYEFQAWSDGVTTASRTDTNVTADITVTANFEPNQYTLTYTAGAGGTLTGNTNQVVAHGGSGTEVTAVANEGYTFTNWSDGITTASRTDTNVTADISVTANFEISQYTLTYTAGEGGTLTGDTNQTVTHGGSGTEVTAVAGTGYEFHEWSDGIATESRTDTNVIGDINVSALFVEQPTLYTLTYSHSAGGTVDGNTLQIVVSGEDGQEVTAIPNEGYNFIQWSDNLKTPSRRDTNVTSNIFVEANFALLIYVDENFSEETVGWGETHFSDIQVAIDSCTHNSGCKYTISQEQSLILENSVPFTSKQIFEFTNGLQIIFPENVEITEDASWDNILLLPRHLDSPSLNLDVKTRDIVKLGSQNTNLTLSQPIRLLIPGEAGENVGYIKAQGTTFNEIENICSEDSENAINNPNEECKIDIGNDLVIWTNHLTEFITYEDNEEESGEEAEIIDGEEEQEETSDPLPQTGTGILTTFSLASIFLAILIRKKILQLQRLW